MPKKKAINLLPLEEFNASTTGRVLKWATSTFRIIVIITEMVVMAAFLSRFWLDARNSALNNSIRAKSAQISAQTDLEKQFTSVQSKLDIFKNIRQSNNASSLIENIVGRVPENITLTRILLDEKGTVDVQGMSLSDREIAQFIESLNTHPFKNAVLRTASSSEDSPGGTTFVVSITY